MKKKSIVHQEDQTGSCTVEYMVLVTFIGLALISGATALQSSLNTQMVAAGNAVNNILSGRFYTPVLYDPVKDSDVVYYRDRETNEQYSIETDENGQYYVMNSENVYLSSDTYFVRTDEEGNKFVVKGGMVVKPE